MALSKTQNMVFTEISMTCLWCASSPSWKKCNFASESYRNREKRSHIESFLTYGLQHGRRERPENLPAKNIL